MPAVAHDPIDRTAGLAGEEVGQDQQPGVASVPSYSPGGTNPDPVLQTVQDMLRANREAEADQAGKLQPQIRTHTYGRLLWGTFIAFRQVQRCQMGHHASNPMWMDQVQFISNVATTTRCL